MLYTNCPLSLPSSLFFSLAFPAANVGAADSFILFSMFCDLCSPLFLVVFVFVSIYRLTLPPPRSLCACRSAFSLGFLISFVAFITTLQPTL